MMLTAAQMRSLPSSSTPSTTPAAAKGGAMRFHGAGARHRRDLCGMRGYKAISEWVDDLSPKVLERFRVRRRNGQHRAPSLSAMRSLLIRIDPAQLDAALRAWHQPMAQATLPWPSTARRCAAPSMTRAAKRMCSASSATTPRRPWSKKNRHEARPRRREKRTNEIGTILPLLETVPDIEGHTVTTDALLTQRALATYLLGRGAHYLFTVKGNQPNMLDDIRLTLDEHIAQRAPDFTDSSPKPEHGRRERRSIWVSSALNDYLDFPGVAQVFAIGRQSVEVNSGKRHRETVYGVTSLSPQGASPQRLLSLNRGHWTIEATHHILDWSFDEDRSRIRTGHGPENMTRLRRFAIGLIKARGLAVAETMRRLARNPRRVLDFLNMTANAARAPRPPERPCGLPPPPRHPPSAPRGAPLTPAGRGSPPARPHPSPSDRPITVKSPRQTGERAVMKARQRVLDPRDSTPTIRTNLPWVWRDVGRKKACGSGDA